MSDHRTDPGLPGPGPVRRRLPGQRTALAGAGAFRARVPIHPLVAEPRVDRLAAAALALAAALLLTLPRLPRPLPATEPGDRVDLATPLPRKPGVGIGLAVIVLLVTAHFAAYTYIRPVLEERTGLSPTPIAVLLLVYGVFGLAGNFVAGALAARDARRTVLALAGAISTAIALLALFSTSSGVTAAGVALWGLVYGGLSAAGQIWMTRTAAERVEHVTGLYVGMFTAAIALGAFLGGTVVDSAGISVPLWSAAVLAVLSCAAALAAPARRREPDRPAASEI